MRVDAVTREVRSHPLPSDRGGANLNSSRPPPGKGHAGYGRLAGAGLGERVERRPGGVYDPATRTWREWRLPGRAPQAYAVYVDERDVVWLSDFGANALVRFAPDSEAFTSFPLPASPADVRQLGRPGEVWGAESAADRPVVLRS